ncbi:MAG TPA: hypothetical protein VMU15_02050 [Anaeromyxobacter sp.]|nr:hypothetical protein [Anaeromyxobacter sp.]
MTTALAALQALPSPAALGKAALPEAGRRPPPFNAHVHLPPNFSAFASVEQAVELARAQGLALLGTSNYYDFAVYDGFADRCRSAGVFPLFGVELLCRDEDLARQGVKVNDPANPGKVYLCGKGLGRFDPQTPAAVATLAGVRARDGARIAEMVGRCARALAERGCPVDLGADAIVDGLVRRHGSPRATVVLQERHVARAIQEALFAAIPPGERLDRLPRLLGAPVKLKGPDDAVGLQNEVRNHLMKAGKPGFVPESYLDLAEARALVLELGGIPCYPVLADGASPLGQFEATAAGLVANLARLGIHAAELIPNRNAPAVLSDYVKTLRRSGIVVTAGTEHNTLELLPMMPSARGAPIPEELLPIFWEGACVAAAHQYLTSRGEAGFVTQDGAPQPGHPDAEGRIAAFAALGKAVIAAFASPQTPAP